MEYNADKHSLHCPKCKHGMEEIVHQDITVDRCTHCQGLWFDGDEAQRTKMLRDGEGLDAGDPAEGWKWDSVEDIDCPRCGNKMEKASDPDQKHIWYEACPDHGIFMDAGEFTDFKYHTLLDWFRGVVKGDRGSVAP